MTTGIVDMIGLLVYQLFNFGCDSNKRVFMLVTMTTYSHCVLADILTPQSIQLMVYYQPNGSHDNRVWQ